MSPGNSITPCGGVHPARGVFQAAWLHSLLGIPLAFRRRDPSFGSHHRLLAHWVPPPSCPWEADDRAELPAEEATCGEPELAGALAALLRRVARRRRAMTVTAMTFTTTAAMTMSAIQPVHRAAARTAPPSPRCTAMTSAPATARPIVLRRFRRATARAVGAGAGRMASPGSPVGAGGRCQFTFRSSRLPNLSRCPARRPCALGRAPSPWRRGVPRRPGRRRWRPGRGRLT